MTRSKSFGVMALLAAGLGISSQGSFKASGAGSATRKISAKLEDVVSIADYGGSSSASAATNTTALAAAIAQAGSSGNILLPCPGTYATTAEGTLACGLYGPETHVDQAGATASLLSVFHNGSGSSQSYGLDIHNYPDSRTSPTGAAGARSAIVVHQYSDKDGAVQIDNTRSQPIITMRNTHNETLATGAHGTGHFFRFVGYTPSKTYPGTEPVEIGTLEGGSTPLVFASKEIDAPWTFRSDTTGPSLKITQSNAGTALSITETGAGNAMTVLQSAAAIGVNISSDINATGFFPMLVTGYSHGPKFTTTINSGPALTLSQTVAGGNQLFFLDNRGAGASIRLSTDGSNTVGSFTAAGEITTTSTKMKGTCTLNGGTPATCTATVISGATCISTAQGTTAAAAVSLAVSVTTTTLTVTGANGLTNTVNYICLG